jgi:zinc transport system substrate-binding protein
MMLGTILITAGGRRRSATGAHRHRPVVAAAVALAVVAAACGAGRSGGEGDGKLRVVASFYPLAEAAARVGGDRVNVTNLTPPGVEAHDFALTPGDVEAIATADVVVYGGDGFQPAVEEALPEAEGTTVDVLAGVPSSGGAGTDTVVDPHVWLDPELYQQVVEEVRRALADADPAGAAVYARNARAFEGELAALDGEFSSGLATCERRVIVTTHAAFGYLASTYGLTQEAIMGLSPEAEPDARHLAELDTYVKQHGITTVFTETQVSPEVANTLAAEAGVTTAVLNPLESLTRDQLDAGQDYASVMRQNLATLRSALGCA